MTDALPVSDRPKHTLEWMQRMHATMLRIRLCEEQLAEMITAGEIHTPCHLCIGQEAIAAGTCAALMRTDTIWGGHRSHGHYLAKGGDLTTMLAEILGKASGCSLGRGGSMHLASPAMGILGTVPLVAATIPLAVGAGLASRLRGENAVAVAFFGDGATEEGHFHESLNLASLYRLPVIFVCENNLYASHLALEQRRAEDNIVQSGAAHGMPAERLDGNDAVEVYDAVARAVKRARAGEGPTLLEFRTYRWRGHVGPSWDMDVGVRRKDELHRWLPLDPIARLRAQLINAGDSEGALQAREQAIRDEIAQALEVARAALPPTPESHIEHVFVKAQ